VPAPRRLAHLLALAGCLLAVTAPWPAYAQDRTPTPSAEELWRDYPLDQGEPAATAAPSPARAATRTAPADDDGSGGTIAAVLAAAGAAAAGAAAFVLRRRRMRPDDARTPVPVPRLAVARQPARPKAVLFSTAGNGAQGAGGREPPERGAARERRGLRPPDEARDWTAEIRWQHSGGESRFCAIVSDGGGETVIARSEPLDWPPQDSHAVQALVEAVDALSEALTIAGWTPIAGGAAWYEKRFRWLAAPASTEWAPPRPVRSVAPAPDPPPARAGGAPARRFRQPAAWPADSERLPRCEIKWRPGYARSRFEVVMHDPGRRDRVIAGSAPFKWLFMSDPQPGGAAFRDALRELVAALESAGWERVGVGVSWYAIRFVWRSDGAPPDDIPRRTHGHSTT
jgi:hypothetical protein